VKTQALTWLIMITQQLLKPPKLSLVERVKANLPALLRRPATNAEKPIFDNATQEWIYPDGTRRPLGFTNDRPYSANHGSLSSIWTKHSYSLWIEQVKEKFKVGDYITHRRNPIVPNWCPLAYKIIEIGEIRHLVPFDTARNLPKALTVVLVGSTVPTHWVPDDTRHLTKDELDCDKKILEEMKNDNSKTVEEEFPQREPSTSINPNAV
jgi:hypothetical protein